MNRQLFIAVLALTLAACGKSEEQKDYEQAQRELEQTRIEMAEHQAQIDAIVSNSNARVNAINIPTVPQLTVAPQESSEVISAMLSARELQKQDQETIAGMNGQDDSLAGTHALIASADKLLASVAAQRAVFVKYAAQIPGSQEQIDQLNALEAAWITLKGKYTARLVRVNDAIAKLRKAITAEQAVEVYEKLEPSFSLDFAKLKLEIATKRRSASQDDLKRWKVELDRLDLETSYRQDVVEAFPASFDQADAKIQTMLAQRLEIDQAIESLGFDR